MKKAIQITLVLLVSFSVMANPNVVINLDAHYDKNHNLINPDQALLLKAVKSYKAGYNQSALKNFTQAAAFGNADAQMYVGLMHLKSLGVDQDWAKGYAWIKLAALSGSKKHIELKNNIYSQLKPTEIKLSNIEYKIISKDYSRSATLNRRDRWAKKQKRNATGTRTGSQTSNVQSKAFNGAVLDNDRSSNIELMNTFVSDYHFGIVTSGEIVPQGD